MTVRATRVAETAVSALLSKSCVKCVPEPLPRSGTVSTVSVTGSLRNVPLLGAGPDS